MSATGARSTLFRSATTHIERVVAGSSPPRIEKRLDRHRASAEHHSRLRRAFHLSRLIGGDAVVAALDLREDDDHLTITFADDGARSLDRLLADGPLATAAAVRVAAGVAAALAHVHAAGFVHGHLDASHVLIAPVPTRSGVSKTHVRLIGLGAARALGTPLFTSSQLRFEQVGDATMATHLAEVSEDLQALGRLLHEMLTGWPVQVGTGDVDLPAESAGERSRDRDRSRKLRQAALAVARQLLEQPTAPHLRDASAVHTTLRALTDELPWPPAGPSTVLLPSQPARVYGRDAEREQLQALFAQARHGRLSSVLLVGPRGSGRRRLLADLGRGLSALAAPAGEPSANASGDALADPLAAPSGDSLPVPVLAAFVAVDDVDTDEYTLLFAALSQWWHPDQAAAGTSSARSRTSSRTPIMRVGNRHAHGGLSQALAGLPELPLLWVIDGIDRLDAGVFKRLLAMLPARLPLLIAGCCESLPAGIGDGCDSIRLPPLGGAAMGSLLADALALPVAAVARLAPGLHAASQGLPGVALDLLQHVCEQGAVRRTDAGVSVDAGRLAQLLNASAERTPPAPPATDAVQALACLGPSSLDVIAATVGTTPDATRQHLADAISSGRVQARFDNDLPTYAFRHAAARGSVWSALSANARARWHTRAAAALGEALAAGPDSATTGSGGRPPADAAIDSLTAVSYRDGNVLRYAHHLTEAFDPASATEATRLRLAETNLEAGRIAASHGRWQLSCRRYRAGLAAAPTDNALVAMLCAGAARAAWLGGDDELARHSLLQAPPLPQLVAERAFSAASAVAQVLEFLPSPESALTATISALGISLAPPRRTTQAAIAARVRQLHAAAAAQSSASNDAVGAHQQLLVELLLQSLRADAPAARALVVALQDTQLADGGPFAALAAVSAAALEFADGHPARAQAWLAGHDRTLPTTSLGGLAAGIVYHALVQAWFAAGGEAWLTAAVPTALAVQRPDLAAFAAAHALAACAWQTPILSRFLPLAEQLAQQLPAARTAADATIAVYRSAVTAMRAGSAFIPATGTGAMAQLHAAALGALSAAVRNVTSDVPAALPGIPDPVHGLLRAVADGTRRRRRSAQCGIGTWVGAVAAAHAARSDRPVAWLDVDAPAPHGEGVANANPARRLLAVGRRLAAASDAMAAAQCIVVEARSLLAADWCCVVATQPETVLLAQVARSRHLLPALPGLSISRLAAADATGIAAGTVTRLPLGDADVLLFASPLHLDAEMVLVAHLFAEQAGIALANARLFATTVRSRDAFRTLFDTAREGLAEFATDGLLLRANAALASMLGHASADELLCERRAIVDLFGDPASARALVDAALADITSEAEVTLAARGGAPVPASVQMRASRGSDGELRLRAAFADLVERERRQEAERERERADSQAAARSAFLAHMSHEIRTPLNAIVGYTRLARTAPPNRRGEHLATIDRAAQQLLRLVNDVLDLSRIDAGQLEFERVAFVLGDVLREVALLHAQAAAERSTTIEVADDVSLPPGYWLAGDRHRIAQVVTNLVANAVRFTDSGTIRLAAVPIAIGGERAQFEVIVADTGIGIDEHLQARVFEPYVQAGAETARQYGGSGLGLAIVERLIAGMGGKVVVESQPGAGTRFRCCLTLPLTAQPPATEHTGDVDLAGAAVLLVDDDPVNRALGAELLEGAGAHVTVAASGEEALQSARVRSFAAVLMDLRMPGMDGYAACRALRALPLHAGTPVVALTADATIGARTDALAAGFADYLTKPLDPAQMLRTLARHAVGTVNMQPLRRSADGASGTPPKRRRDAERLPGINVADALARHRGDSAFLGRMLNEYLQHYRDAPQQLQTLLSAGQTDAAARLAHSLAGVAGSFGGQRLAARCRDLEQALDAGQTQVAGLLARLERAHAEFTGSAQALASAQVRLRASDNQ